jgi:hypothetical protein
MLDPTDNISSPNYTPHL